MNFTGCTEREWKENVEYFRSQGWTFERWYDYGHAYGLGKRAARNVWNRFASGDKVQEASELIRNRNEALERYGIDSKEFKEAQEEVNRNAYRFSYAEQQEAIRRNLF